MITKLVFTLVIVGLGYLYWLRSQRKQMAPKVERSTVATNRSPAIKTGGNLRFASYALIAFMVLASGIFIYLEWRDQYRVVEVTVINTHTGDRGAYRARRGDIDGRVFETIDGRVVRLADIERLELGSADKTLAAP